MSTPPAALIAQGTRATEMHEIVHAPWGQIEGELDARGFSVMRGVLSVDSCASLRALYVQQELFRKRIEMQRHGYGRGEYQYFRYPLPPLVQSLRALLYARLVPLANRWNGALRREVRYPVEHADFLAACHHAGQTRPTPLILKYGPGDYNCLHQDLYGEHVFPLQVAVLLSRPGADFEGGDFVLTEQRPRMQSRAHVVPLEQGDAVVFAVERRPAQGKRGTFQVNMRHGVSELRRGERYTLGIIMHDAS
jgi:hypothetical protein